jgi:transketolase
MQCHLLETPPETQCISATLRCWIIQRSLASRVGHIGSALSIVEIMAALWGRILRRPASASPDRDRFVLAKGHAALALYAAMRYRGLIDEETFNSFCADGSLLGVHPERGLPGVEVATGSLGQGLSVACGLAYALKRRRSPARVFVVLSDAECNEGQVWEAASFAAHHALDNLAAVIDLNGMQAMGPTRAILNMAPMAERWRAFGWRADDVDGHDEQALVEALASATGRGLPTVLIAHTVMGKGISFMENRLEWHYRNLTPELAEQALEELRSASIGHSLAEPVRAD